ncbi:MAG: hypothetical protein BWX95_01467 [Bacteroidetes bacterium ADurb.Bin141]|nr:YdcF family protein [Bacteroidia bacterium]MBX3107177.1 YdcF family protein [Bacteroidota bacterium]MCE7955785.1 YdcF family protein [Bacteroidetes bacterium CHB6]OQB62206.1 MAG: hypothetical protein BWX95_01467 [Bacteroidetes bacterium ADurb.Bin141]MCB0849211.1 YdcF family protein [Bacteroidota bacterium]
MPNKLTVAMASATMLLFFSSCYFNSRKAAGLLKDAEKKTYDIIVVPGVPLVNGQWSDVMKARVYWSKYLFDKGIARNIMYSGSSVYTPYKEGEVMAMYAKAIGIPAEHIFTETKAEHSTENIYYSYKKAKKLGFNTVALASDPFQSKLLKSFIKRKVSREVGIIPFIADTLRAMQPTMTDPVLDFSALKVENFTALPEREGFWKRFRGTRGHNIDKNAYSDTPVSREK